ncbi:MBL fold metallo-hydrolase [Sulfitobacter sp. D35]|uniref:MBL fold metallo-hydrolase n=1 Tax=Sulfitobacter sp. D35 TaxID=3083252 RepID=UPI00296F49C8|nr:MBL fold metallo-hydrolase [Sulfitobacter sp. D35]MDW4498408.1 MBL fold metallo-hydrolase [Sulfitobacter sp. D35]
MSNTRLLTRRAALAGAAAMPLAGGLAGTVFAGAPMSGVQVAPFRRLKVGEFDVTTLLAGTRAVPDPHTIFGLNVDAETFAEASQDANIPTDQAQFFFTPTIVNTGSELVLFDTGLSAEGTRAAIEAAGYTTDQVDVVVLTHMHGDHIGGMTHEDGTPTYSNARYVTGQAEYDHWAAAGNEGFDAKVKPFAEQFTFLEDEGEVAGGLTAIAAFGHTPGHCCYRVESGDQQLVIGADFANHYVWSVAHPDWEVKFDMDKARAAETRRRLLDMMATDKLPFIGYHMPWPGVGYVETSGDGFAYVPHSYQLML